MVSAAFQQDYEPIAPSEESEKLSTTIRLSEVVDAGVRLEASAFSIEAHNAVTALQNSGLKLIPLYGAEGLCQEAHNAFRFKRIYVDHDYGVPFLSSSEIISLCPETDRYLSRKHTRKLETLLIKKWDVLISRSGTIGNIGLATESFVGQALSEDVIRVRADSPDTAGYITAFLRSRYGRYQLTQATYGSVIVHIELEHLERVLIPSLPSIRRIAIGRLMCKAGELRDEANRLLDEAERLLHERLSLPYLKDIAPRGKSESSIAKIKASQLMGRLEASFHDPVAIAAENQLSQLPLKISTLGDYRVAKEVRAITKFRKRIYVEKGIPLLNSKQLFQVDPVGLKFLAKGAHIEDLPEISLEENMLAITCSGTIGKVQIIPRYMEGWASSQDSIRVVASKQMNSGYLYAWLSSDYGECLIKRQTYGSVITHIDREMLSSVQIPLPKTGIRDEIGNLVLKANELRDEAWRNEQEAIRKLENLIARQSASEPESASQLSPILNDLTFDPDETPIWELAAQISAQIPEEDWQQLPTDLARRFDYYQAQRQGQD